LASLLTFRCPPPKPLHPNPQTPNPHTTPHQQRARLVSTNQDYINRCIDQAEAKAAKALRSVRQQLQRLRALNAALKDIAALPALLQEVTDQAAALQRRCDALAAAAAGCGTNSELKA